MISGEQLEQFKELLPEGVNLLAVSKGHSEKSVELLANYGQFDFGESRLQEALPKIKALSHLTKLRWHFVGRLQANKVRGVVKVFDFIHSVDSLVLAERVSRIAAEENRSPRVFLQIKLREDPTKTGFSAEELLEVWPKLISLSNIEIIGLMTIAPFRLDLYTRHKLFVDCRDFANRLYLRECSMGMSGDWEAAVKAGSTWIRIGSFLFGQRAK